MLKSSRDPFSRYFGWCKSGYALVRQEYVPLVRMVYTAHDIKEGAFPCAIRTDKGFDVALSHLKTDVMQRLKSAKILADFPNS